jgi:hypothetical protein
MTLPSKNTSGLIGGSVLIGVGLLLLVAQFLNALAWQHLWPFIVIGAGSLFFVGMFAGDRQAAGLAIPGSIVTGVGLMLLVQNLTAHWASWSYGWTVILMSVGAGIWIMGWRTENAAQRESGLGVLRVGFILFVIFGAFFEVLLSGAGGPALRRILFPALLIVMGLVMIVRRLGWWPRAAGSPPADAPAEPPPGS